MLVDSHCHLHLIDYKELGQTEEETVNFARKSDISRMLCVATTLSQAKELYRISDKYNDIDISIGLHPNEEVDKEPSLEDILALAQHPSVVAIGETGLDYYRDYAVPQKERFVTHINAAIACDKPLIIHTRMARKDTIDILRAEKADIVGGVLHCFTEDLDMAKAGIDLGFYVSFSGIVSFKNASELREVVKSLPLDRILIETDCPYLAPVPYRGKINQPAYVREVCTSVASIHGIPFEKIAQITTENYYKVFGRKT